MKEFKLTLAMPDNFKPGECLRCPLAAYIPSTGNSVCAMGYRYYDCPLREGQTIEEDYTD